MKYQLIDSNEKHVDAIAKAMKNADALYLATDPDREGEAISWHLYELLKATRLLKNKPVHRVVFHEITKRAIQEAVQHPRDISYGTGQCPAGAPRPGLPGGFQSVARCCGRRSAAACRRDGCRARPCA